MTKRRLRVDGDLSYFWQWDLNRRLIVDDDGACSQVHFCNGAEDLALVCEIKEIDGQRIVNVPNILLHTALHIMAYLYISGEDGSLTRYSERFQVIARAKPEDYVYTETEVLQWKTLEQRVLDGLAQTGVYMPDVAPDGELSWRPSKETLPEGPKPVNIRGPVGPSGPQGERGDAHFATFCADPDGHLYLTGSEAPEGVTFEINTFGHLEVTYA